MSSPTKKQLVDAARKLGILDVDPEATNEDLQNAIDAKQAEIDALKEAEGRGESLKFPDDALRLEQILENAHLFFERTPKFLVEQALRADGKAVYTLPEAQSLVEQFTAPTPGG